MHVPARVVSVRTFSHRLIDLMSVTVCLPLPCVSLPIFGFSCHHYLISLHLCLDFVPGVSSYVPLHIVCSAPCFGWIIVNVSTSVSVCTCLCHLRVLLLKV